MPQNNLILDSLNQALATEILLQGPEGLPIPQPTLDGVPLGTKDNSSTGEVGAKVIVIGGTLTASPGGLVIPQSDEITLTYVGSTNNIDTVTYKFQGNTVAQLQISYVGGTPSTDDALISSVATI